MGLIAEERVVEERTADSGLEVAGPEGGEREEAERGGAGGGALALRLSRTTLPDPRPGGQSIISSREGRNVLFFIHLRK